MSPLLKFLSFRFVVDFAFFFYFDEFLCFVYESLTWFVIFIVYKVECMKGGRKSSQCYYNN